MLRNKPTGDAVNTLRADINRLIQQQSFLPNRPNNIPDDNSLTNTSSEHITPVFLTENPLNEAFRARARVESIDLFFSTGQKQPISSQCSFGYYS